MSESVHSSYLCVCVRRLIGLLTASLPCATAAAAAAAAAAALIQAVLLGNILSEAENLGRGLRGWGSWPWISA
jgi:hypothetical protein